MIKGIGRFEKEASFVTEGVQRYDESSTNGVAKRPESVKKQLITVFLEGDRVATRRKRPLKTKKSVGFQHITVSFASFSLVLIFLFIFGLFRSYQM